MRLICHGSSILTATVLIQLSIVTSSGAETGHQYSHGSIEIPAARATEPFAKQFSFTKALDYLDQGARAWSQARNCISCHTNGSYLLVRPALTELVGPPATDIREFFVDELREFQTQDIIELRRGINPTQIAYLASGLAEWDVHVSKSLSPETDAALRLMFSVQSDNGAFSNDDCWPPLESSEFHGATVAAMAAVTAPGWLKAHNNDSKLTGRFKKLTGYLRDTEPPHDYARLLLLWAATRVPNLIDEARRNEFIKMVWNHQQQDGGWSIRTFAEPEAWGNGNRAAKLKAEASFNNPSSDGHQTGLALLVLTECGISKNDPRVQKAVQWLLANQRKSGRWWTQSLNTDKSHFITFSGTCYPLLALAKCGALPSVEENREPRKTSSASKDLENRSKRR